MSVKLNFLKTVKPFNILPEDVMIGVADLLQEIRYTKDTAIYHQEETKMKGVDLIAKGEYEAFFYDSEQNKRVIDHHGPGYCYGGVSVLMNRKRSLRSVIAKKDTVVFFLPRRDFKQLCLAYEEFFHFFTSEFGRRMLNDEYAHFVKRPTSFEENFIVSDQLYSRKVETLTYREIVKCTGNTPIYLAAKQMAGKKVSCLFVTDEHHDEQIIGYLTDITIRDNVVAKLVNPQEPVSLVMDNPILSIKVNAYVYEAILLMFRTKTRYLLVEDAGKYVGFMSRNKLLGELAQSPFVFIQSVKLAQSVEELRAKWNKVPEIVYQLLNRGVKPEIVNQVITTVSDTIALKVIEGVIEKMGTPPAKFVFMVLGSEGRKEQTLNTDQDNAIIYEDKANEQRELVREYFLKFAEQVSGQLDSIGFSFCKGGFMAKNSKWTHSLSHWKRNYSSWMEDPDPETVMKFSTFFDCRCIYGESAIIDELRDFLDHELQKPLGRFLYHMANNALQYEPPLTFFKNIRTFTKGSQEVFDIKKTMTPIVDLVRVHSLINRIFKTNTGERLEALKAKGEFTQADFQELMHAYYYLMSLRLKKQAVQIIQDKTDPDNLINIGSLTKIEQVTLKEIFKTIANFQLSIKMKFTNSLLS
jgi:CBS domain-containing protein